MTNAIERSRGLGSAFPELRAKWWLFTMLGIALLGLGFLGFANLSAATVPSVFHIGVLMSVAGIAQVVHAFNIQGWRSFAFWLSSGFAYAIAGIAAFHNPLLAALAYTLVLAITLIAAGILRFWVGLQSRRHLAWGWVAFSGTVTLLAGLVILFGRPFSTLAAPAAILAIDLTMQGATFLAFGFGLTSSALSWVQKIETGERESLGVSIWRNPPEAIAGSVPPHRSTFDSHDHRAIQLLRASIGKTSSAPDQYRVPCVPSGHSGRPWPNQFTSRSPPQQGMTK
ncbi:HdeD family acid-resistance protein [Mesorhizobium calcicola]|uniref:HdeD family acid-resistance protein n=1 Tax=Mesorhizobium calcicola TaxID=1300310 RepID=A0ABW4WI89_9HYPH